MIISYLLVKKNYFTLLICNFILLLIARSLGPKSCLKDYILSAITYKPVANKTIRLLQEKELKRLRDICYSKFQMIPENKYKGLAVFRFSEAKLFSIILT